MVLRSMLENHLFPEAAGLKAEFKLHLSCQAEAFFFIFLGYSLLKISYLEVKSSRIILLIASIQEHSSFPDKWVQSCCESERKSMRVE
ncbi:hypothetical protein NC653_025442 [Populus alba x Populus x berolinensis]|uniref:Uncharacterized protein n=1 Tax=Populus alba x Populus x berolinensis TaxID=444605 RepID=A0AAD6MDL4_9ROSI|nr:hypothetical protein NC653_025442 [Populus alba x Populus x berolinensis]